MAHGFKRTSSNSGTSLKGYLPADIPVERIAEVFGPSDGPGDKTDFEWAIRFDDGLVATIYDYKGCRWHVGGRDHQVVERVAELLGVEAERSSFS